MSFSISHPKPDSGTRPYRALFHSSSLPEEYLLQQARNSLRTGTFPHQTCSVHGFSSTGQGLRCDAPGPAAQESLQPFPKHSQLWSGTSQRAQEVQNGYGNAYVEVTLISQRQSQGGKGEMNVLYDTALLLGECVSKDLKLSPQGA